MDRIKIPLMLNGSWDHLFIMTFGADLPFFERSLLPQLSAQCRNKVILCNGKQYLEECSTYARNSRLVRHFNRTYVADGIFSFVSHAKIILLVNKQQGRLLVGSGNLNVDGYAGGGELFTRYEFSDDFDDHINAFLTIREMMEWLIDTSVQTKPVSNQVIRQIGYLLSETPWLYRSSISQDEPVRSNIAVNFIDQLVTEVGAQKVDELWVLSPFYDKEVRALQLLLKKLQPRIVKLLVQNRYTSIDGDVLATLRSKYPGQFDIHPFSLNIDDKENSYVHAKLYIIKSGDKAFCLQGSPNLSQVAMVRRTGYGNLEVANLIQGNRDDFDYIIDGLHIFDSVTDVAELELEYQSDDTDVDNETPQFYLKSSEFDGRSLKVRVEGELPTLASLVLLIEGEYIPYDSVEYKNDELVFVLPHDLGTIFSRPCPIALQWGEDNVTNPIFPINRKTLQDHLKQQVIGKNLPGIGDLESDDSDLEQLLNELEATLVIDEQSIWNLFRHNPTSNIENNITDLEDVIRIGDVDIDVTTLQKHPSIHQYARWGSSFVGGMDDTPLQIIMRAISKHFTNLLQGQTSELSSLEELDDLFVTVDNLADGQTEDEIEEAEQEIAQRRISLEQRLSRHWKRFIKRYLYSLRDVRFPDLVGFEVMAQNYYIFSHILWKLGSKEWFEKETDFLIVSISELLCYFWGDDDNLGYFSLLDRDDWQKIHQFLMENHSYEIMFTLYFQCANQILVLKQVDEAKAHHLSTSLQNLLKNPPYIVHKNFILSLWMSIGDLPLRPSLTPMQIIDQLERLARFNTEDGFLQYIENKYGYSASTCDIKRVNIQDRNNAYSLNINDKGALSSIEEIEDLLHEWMIFQPMNYYRIQCEHDGNVLKLVQYDTESKDARFLYDWQTGEEQNLSIIDPLNVDWGKSIISLRQMAQEAQEDIQFLKKHVDA